MTSECWMALIQFAGAAIVIGLAWWLIDRAIRDGEL